MRRTVAMVAVLLAGIVPAFGQEGSSRSAGSTSFLAMEKLVVDSGERLDVNRLADGGVFSADGAREIVVNLVGELKGKADRDGVLGVMLVPALPFFEKAFRNKKTILFSHENAAPVSAGESGLFSAAQKRFDVGFPRYRVYVYDTTGAPAEVNVYIYLVP